MNTIQSKVLHQLLDQYEESKTFSGTNKVNQSFSITVGKIFPRYKDDAEYEYFCQVNDRLWELEHQRIISLQEGRAGVVEKVFLNLEHLEDCYQVLNRIPRQQEHQGILELLEELRHQIQEQEYLPLLCYIQAQVERIAGNKKVEYYDGSLDDYQDLLKLARAILENKAEVFVRDFSIELFHDSKRVEQLQTKVQSMLYQYGDYENRDSVLEECGIVHTPTYVMMKGQGKIWLAGQCLDLSKMKGDIALSTESLKDMIRIEVLEERVITVENLTSFHDYPGEKDFVIYLGGFHNRIKRGLIQHVYEANKNKKFLHFGDIDAGGFYILEHLKEKTGIPFHSLYMDRDTLLKYQDQCKPLTQQDRKRLQDILNRQREMVQRGEEFQEDYSLVIKTMLELGCKLEQEAVKVTTE